MQAGGQASLPLVAELLVSAACAGVSNSVRVCVCARLCGGHMCCVGVGMVVCVRFCGGYMCPVGWAWVCVRAYVVGICVLWVWAWECAPRHAGIAPVGGRAAVVLACKHSCMCNLDCLLTNF